MSYNYDPKLQGMLAYAIGMSTNGAEVLYTVQSNEQVRARNCCMLPQKIKPNKEAFETLGFTFEDTGDSILYKTIKPLIALAKSGFVVFKTNLLIYK